MHSSIYLARPSFLFNGYDKMWCWEEIPVIFKLVVQSFYLKLSGQLFKCAAHVAAVVARCCFFEILKMFLWKIVDVFVVALFLKVYLFFSSLIAAAAKVNVLLWSFVNVLALLVLVMLLHRTLKPFRPFRGRWTCDAGNNFSFSGTYLPFTGVFSLGVRIQPVTTRCLQRFQAFPPL